MSEYNNLPIMNKNQKSLEDYPDVVTVSELAEILRIHQSTAYELLQSGALVHRRIGSAYRISKYAIKDFLESTK